MRTFADAEIYEADQKRRRAGEARPPGGSRPTPRLGGLNDPLLPGAVLPAATPSRGAAAAAGAPRSGSCLQSLAAPWQEPRGAAAALGVWRSHRGVQLDVTVMPGFELLSAKVGGVPLGSVRADRFCFEKPYHKCPGLNSQD